MFSLFSSFDCLIYILISQYVLNLWLTTQETTMIYNHASWDLEHSSKWQCLHTCGLFSNIFEETLHQKCFLLLEGALTCTNLKSNFSVGWYHWIVKKLKYTRFIFYLEHKVHTYYCKNARQNRTEESDVSINLKGNCWHNMNEWRQPLTFFDKLLFNWKDSKTFLL